MYIFSGAWISDKDVMTCSIDENFIFRSFCILFIRTFKKISPSKISNELLTAKSLYKKLIKNYFIKENFFEDLHLQNNIFSQA
jgi:hypothetical protein